MKLFANTLFLFSFIFVNTGNKNTSFSPFLNSLFLQFQWTTVISNRLFLTIRNEFVHQLSSYAVANLNRPRKSDYYRSYIWLYYGYICSWIIYYVLCTGFWFFSTFCLNNSNKPTISYQGITKYACHADDNNKSKCLWSQRITNGREKFYRLSVCFHWFKPNLDTSEIKRKLGAAGLFVLDKLSFNDRTVVVLNTEQIPRNPWVHQKALGQGCRQILNLMFIY